MTDDRWVLGHGRLGSQGDGRMDEDWMVRSYLRMWYFFFFPPFSFYFLYPETDLIGGCRLLLMSMR